MEICSQCMKIHNNHQIKKLENKELNYKNDLEEFEKFLMNNEDKKKIIKKKVEENIYWFNNYKNIDKNIKINDELNLVIEKILKKFYKELEKGQDLAFFSHILFETYIKMDKNDEKIILYKNLIDKISQFYNEEKIKEFDLKNFSVSRDYKDTSKCVYKENYDFIPQIKLKFNDVKKIDQEIIDSLINECKKLLNEKDVKIIEIKKGSLSIVIALNYLIQDKL